jgi:hypothetical protein
MSVLLTTRWQAIIIRMMENCSHTASDNMDMSDKSTVRATRLSPLAILRYFRRRQTWTETSLEHGRHPKKNQL